jgi:hypothetical protein
MELVDRSGHNWFVMFADEAQRLDVIEYEWLRDVHDELERRGVQVKRRRDGTASDNKARLTLKRKGHRRTVRYDRERKIGRFTSQPSGIVTFTSANRALLLHRTAATTDSDPVKYAHHLT